jgi:hypothetical protein
MYRERLTVTLDPELLTAIDQLVDGQTLRNRSHAIEHLLKEGIGIHELRQAFVFFDNGWTAEQLATLAALLGKTSVKKLFLGMPAAQMAEINAVLREANPDLEPEQVPPDFGDGGAIVLKRAKIDRPFLIFRLGSGFHTPLSLIPAYAFHRQHHAPLTRLLTQDYQPAEIEIANPEILVTIPAGIADLRTNVFPALAKEGKVRGYVIPT